ncbi:carbohydrate kinase family protein [Clostridium sp. C105KSO13]|uniref:carbohydrate kinase family protein n=1 Tax=Clostridium sp. C105KSO13 TaxID=1776045 RepID=UPI00074060F4|nr:carbohydrate kinase family protein [Clostridium sp. C105KSO13]CUX37712.1 aminoimidazole riboside kinase [Clostridium sp. C105KSO13]
MRQKKIIVAGHISLDITPVFENSSRQRFSDLLKPGKLVNVGTAQISKGGAVSNTGLALHKLGSDVTLLGKTGKDLFGEVLRKQISETGCRMDMILSDTDATSYTIVIAPKGSDRAFLHDPGCNKTFTYDEMDLVAVREADYFHFGYPPLMKKFYENDGEMLERMYREIKQNGLVTSLDLAAVDPDSDAGMCDWERVLRKVLPYVDFFVPSIEELGYMLDKERYNRWQKEAGGEEIISVLSLEKDIAPIAEKALSFGCRAVMIKCGAAGMYLRTSDEQAMGKVDSDLKGWGNQKIFQRSYLPERVLSGTGAGDTSIAAFLKAVMEGESPKRSLEYAAATGACCVTTYDTISGLLGFKELRRRIDNGWEQQDLLIP